MHIWSLRGVARARAAANRGFTIIELMLVVGLLGVLISIAIPAYGSYRNKALTRAAAQDIAAMSSAAANYWNDARAYPESLTDIGMGAKLDPWGRAYVYYNIDAHGKGKARKDHALNPINTDFDLYSLGPDGQTKSQISHKLSVDDVIRASNGAFVGKAADF
jgi:general secretion pathway protein G